MYLLHIPNTPGPPAEPFIGHVPVSADPGSAGTAEQAGLSPGAGDRGERGKAWRARHQVRVLLRRNADGFGIRYE